MELPGATRASVCRPLGSIIRPLGRPAAEQRIMDFSTPSKIDPRAQKIDPRVPKGPFLMDFEVILASIFQAFSRQGEMS